MRLRLNATSVGLTATLALTLALFGTLILIRFIAPLPGPVRGRVREYFIAAEEIDWDYAPMGGDPMTGRYFNGSTMPLGQGKRSLMMKPHYGASDLELAVIPSSTRIGRIFRKARYVEYTSAFFDTLKPHDSAWMHLGLLGPPLRAEVGDMIRVTFYNRCSFPASIHPHALLYMKADEGVGSSNDTGPHNSHRRQFGGDHGGGHGAGGGTDGLPPLTENRGDGNVVQPGEFHVYEWLVPSRAGPGPADGSSTIWLYHSHVNEVADVSTGLLGPVIITRRGAARSSKELRPRDVDREFVVSLTIIDENASHLLQQSIDHAWPNITNDTRASIVASHEFQAANVKHPVNGYLYANLPGLSMTVNETVRWYLFSMGSETDVHGAHWHGATVEYDRRRADSIEIIPGSAKVLDMTPDSVGEWMLHCHTHSHLRRGMSAIYDVQSGVNKK